MRSISFLDVFVGVFFWSIIFLSYLALVNMFLDINVMFSMEAKAVSSVDSEGGGGVYKLIYLLLPFTVYVYFVANTVSAAVDLVVILINKIVKRFKNK